MEASRSASGTFISLDGIDGCGKSTHVRRLSAWLTEQGYPVVTCRDPGGTPLGDRIRGIVLDVDAREMCRRCEMFLYMASRSQLVEEVIGPSLAEGKVVVSDRYLMANVAYQGGGGRLGLDTIADIGRLATEGVMPDLVIVLDIDPARARSRLQGGPDRMEQHDAAFYDRVREGFLELARRDPRHTRVLDADRPIEHVAASIQTEVMRVLAGHSGTHTPG